MIKQKLAPLAREINIFMSLIIKRKTSIMNPEGYIAGGKAVGYIEYNRERDACDVVIDGKPYTWAELERNIRAHEGWKIKIEFGDVGDELD